MSTSLKTKILNPKSWRWMVQMMFLLFSGDFQVKHVAFSGDVDASSFK